MPYGTVGPLVGTGIVATATIASPHGHTSVAGALVAPATF